MKKIAYLAAAIAVTACGNNQNLVIGDVTYTGEKTEEIAEEVKEENIA